ncbi:hypothetical protein GGP99_003583 [Salinibacter ruber]|uniref:Uncharacterized protein n=1 Tax=Salinibacter ruber TaxID=146919 RepID=A0AAW5PCB3_9BACT|nr:hypothetical protein [Salinibacter ruber]MCS4223278.1 hypothetical protein [Salinibacter ruber]
MYFYMFFSFLFFNILKLFNITFCYFSGFPL